MNATISLNSLAHCCQILQRPFGVVSTAAKQLNIAPAELRDGCPYFTDHQVETLRRHFEQKAEARNG